MFIVYSLKNKNITNAKKVHPFIDHKAIIEETSWQDTDF